MGRTRLINDVYETVNTDDARDRYMKHVCRNIEVSTTDVFFFHPSPNDILFLNLHCNRVSNRMLCQMGVL
jgi:hypothetical protein